MMVTGTLCEIDDCKLSSSKHENFVALAIYLSNNKSILNHN